MAHVTGTAFSRLIDSAGTRATSSSRRRDQGSGGAPAAARRPRDAGTTPRATPVPSLLRTARVVTGTCSTTRTSSSRSVRCLDRVFVVDKGVPEPDASLLDDAQPLSKGAQEHQPRPGVREARGQCTAKRAAHLAPMRVEALALAARLLPGARVRFASSSRSAVVRDLDQGEGGARQVPSSLCNGLAPVLLRRRAAASPRGGSERHERPASQGVTACSRQRHLPDQGMTAERLADARRRRQNALPDQLGAARPKRARRRRRPRQGARGVAKTTRRRRIRPEYLSSASSRTAMGSRTHRCRLDRARGRRAPGRAAVAVDLGHPRLPVLTRAVCAARHPDARAA